MGLVCSGELLFLNFSLHYLRVGEAGERRTELVRLLGVRLGAGRKSYRRCGGECQLDLYR